jgi:phosphoserine phosphatase
LNKSSAIFYPLRLPIFVYRINLLDHGSRGQRIILLKVSGQDKPGVTAGLTAVLATYNAIILDIGQADIHETLSLGILFEIEAGSSAAPVLKIYCLKVMN